MGLNHSIKGTLETGILLKNQPKGLRGIVFPYCRTHRTPKHKSTVPERATLRLSDLLSPWPPHMGIITQEQMGKHKPVLPDRRSRYQMEDARRNYTKLILPSQSSWRTRYHDLWVEGVCFFKPVLHHFPRPKRKNTPESLNEVRQVNLFSFIFVSSVNQTLLNPL